jgi:uncharacterized OB-fold protein
MTTTIQKIDFILNEKKAIDYYCKKCDDVYTSTSDKCPECGTKMKPKV